MEFAMDDAERLKRGEAARRRVLGNEQVDRSAKSRNSFNGEWIDWITRSPWHDVWTRPHFDDRTRRILVIGTMLSLGRWEEFKLHVRAALTVGGFSADDIKEIILQQANYCGVPAGNHAFREAEAVLRETGKLP
jgi:alkylhydroperoxidase/carboxymuconolactone decarboxylase family protein YurZ